MLDCLLSPQWVQVLLTAVLVWVTAVYARTTKELLREQEKARIRSESPSLFITAGEFSDGSQAAMIVNAGSLPVVITRLWIRRAGSKVPVLLRYSSGKERFRLGTLVLMPAGKAFLELQTAISLPGEYEIIGYFVYGPNAALYRLVTRVAIESLRPLVVDGFYHHIELVDEIPPENKE